MELLSEECVPAIAAEVDIAIGSKRKRGSVTSKSKRPRKSSQAAKQDKENHAPGSLTLGSTKSSTSISGAAEADTVSTTKRRVLRKAEKKQVADVVLKVDKADLVASVLQQVDNELHIQSFQARSELWERFKVSDVFLLECESLRGLYRATYIQCSTGKDKHARFQLEWYQQCSFMLEDQDNPTVSAVRSTQHCLSDARDISKWVDFRKNCSHICTTHDGNAVMIAVQSAVFNFLTHETATSISSMSSVQDDTSTPSQPPATEPEDVYYRFGGAAIAQMLHNRYRSMYTSPADKRIAISTEISVLKAMQCDDKSVVPASLQYRDRGFMYFPDQALIPFIKAADNKIKKFANSDGIREHGRNIARVATEQARMDESLKKLFKEFMQTKFDSLDEVLSPMNCVYAEFFRKLCNTRLGEFMDCYRQIQATKSGSASLSGQNLRDTLLSQHINLQSQIS